MSAYVGVCFVAENVSLVAKTLLTLVASAAATF